MGIRVFSSMDILYSLKDLLKTESLAFAAESR